GDSFSDDRRADDGRHDEDVIARADAPVRTRIPEKGRLRRHASSGSASRAASLLVRSAKASRSFISVEREASAISVEREASAERSACGFETARSPRPLALATLCVCTCAPAAMCDDAVPIALPYLTTLSPAG